MKEVSRGGWVAKISGAVLVSLLALPSYAQLMLAHEGHHGGGGCVIDTGDFSVTFSAYEVPEGDIPPMHSYCDHLPGVGKVNLTVELSDHAAREIPLAVRLIKEGHDGHESGSDNAATPDKEKNASDEADHSAHEGVDHDGHAAKEDGIVYMPAEVHRSGIIVVAAELKELGQYAVLLEKKDDAGNVSTAVRIPLHVGGGGHGGHGGGFGMMEVAILLIVAGGAAFYFLRRKNNPE